MGAQSRERRGMNSPADSSKSPRKGTPALWSQSASAGLDSASRGIPFPGATSALGPSVSTHSQAAGRETEEQMLRFPLTRRQVLRWGVVGGAAALLPARGPWGCGGTVAVEQPAANFLTASEQRTVHAVTARIIPTDALPGAVEAGAAAYINRLLSQLPAEHEPGNVFAGGPFSNRNAFPDAVTGTASTKFPPDHFAQFIPLTRLQLMSWRVQLLGTAAVPGSDFNTAVLGPVVGLRNQYRTGLAEIQSKSTAMFGADFAALTTEQQDQILAAIDTNFLGLITGHTLEGMFSVPEYGGNTDLVGWNLIHYDGDSQPLGYSIFNESAMRYNERPDKPNSTADPDEDFSGVDAKTQQFLRILVRVVGGPHFP